VLVDVEYASVNGMDVMKANGMMAHMLPDELPVTLGCDCTGTVAAVGGGVTGVAVGDPVIALVMPMAKVHDGAFAEQAVAPAFAVAKRPEGLEARTAGALGLAGAAARIAVDNAALQGGETVLVSGATGGVGSLIVQMAKQAGATVVATATPDQDAFVRDLGADETVDYTGDLAAAVRALRPDGVDVAIHLAGDPMVLAALVRKGGKIVSTLGVSAEQVSDLGIDASPVMTMPSPELLGGLAEAAARGDLRVPITETYALTDVPRAMDDFRAGALGKLVVRVR
jgi:NADPH:quinone reductase-like Zn-dependent oxidoreductase